MTDFLFLEEMMTLCNSTAGSRLMNKKGVGLYGTFCPYMPLSDFTTAAFLQDTEIKTPVFVRFSKTFGREGSADTLRDTVGFSTKFYTREGDFDLICHNMPVYYTNDGRKFLKLYRAMSPAVDTNLTDEKGFWSFVAENPEAIHMALWLYSDRGTVKSYRHVEGFSIGTYRWSNKNGDTFLVRMKWSPEEGPRWINRQEAEFLAGFDPEICARDIYGAVEDGQYPAYRLELQIVKEEEKNRYGFDLTDPTLLWPEEDIPYLVAGKMVLDELPRDYEREIEGTCYSHVSKIPGIHLCENGITSAMVMAHCTGVRHRGGDVG